MSNPDTELENETASQPETELSEADILKRLEPKDEDGEEAAQEAEEGQQDDADDGTEAEEGQEAEGQEDAQAKPEDAWLQNKRKITVQGEELEVTADEAFKGYMRQQDYTRKTAETAQLTKAAAQEREFVKREYEARINQLNVLGAVLHQELVGDQAQLAALIDNPPEYLRMQQRMGEKAQRLNELQQHALAIQAMQTNEAQRLRQESLTENEAKLLDALPEWRDAAKRKAETAEIANVLMDAGYAPEELNDLIDHRALLIARDAVRWRKAQAVKAKQVVQAKEPPKAVKPGTANTPTNAKSQQLQKLADRAKRTGKVDDVAAYLAARS